MPIVAAPKREDIVIPPPKQVATVQPAARRRARPDLTMPVEAGTTPDGTIMMRMSAYGREELRSITVPVPRFDGPTAKVRVSGGVTKSLGNFEFARMDVAVELPCQPNETDLQHTYAYASDKVDEFLRYELGVPLVEEEPQ